MANPTPGPWEAHQGVISSQPDVWDVTSKHGWSGNCDATPEGWFVATIHEVDGGDSAKANAALIAAAPELLELAHQYASDLRFPPTADSRERRLERIAAVLAQAGVA